ncbi:MAG: altronate dehydratase family protein, partial [Lachnospiraceae bacterium]|nr:altronate dehydratase family protein [Lachnospiraceae bacterium]
MQDFIRIHREDTVAVALRPLEKGSCFSVDGEKVTVMEDIPQGHKFALCDIGQGEPVMKYGARIGLATEDIRKGGWVHTHNLKTALGELLEYQYEPEVKPLSPQPGAVFQGYKRGDGQTGIRNEIWILPTVGCVNSVAKEIAAKAKECYAVGEGVEDIIAFQHPYG